MPAAAPRALGTVKPMKKVIAGIHLNTSGPLLLGQAVGWFAAGFAISRDLRWAVAAGITGAIVMRAIVRPPMQRLLARYTNNENVVATSHGTTGRIDAVEYFWRPG